MRQLLLDLLPETLPTLDNFVPGGNGETLAALTAWLAADTPASTGFLIWGEDGSGKSHLLQACGFVYRDAQLTPDLELPDDLDDLAVDHVEALSATGQIALFNAFNRLQAQGGRLLTSAAQPPSHLSLREDLRTRLGYGLIYRLQPLSDEEKAAALSRQAEERAMKIPQEALDYLLRHAPRDMRILSALMVALDHYSLEQKRPITLPLLREVLASPPEV